MKLFSLFGPVMWIGVAATMALIASHMRDSSLSLDGLFARAGITEGSTQSAAAAIRPEPTRLASAEDGAAIDVAFSPRPEGAAQRLVIKVIDSAHSSIEMAACEFTSKPIADALIRAAGRGVKVYLVADARENASGGATRVGYVAGADVSARVDDVYTIMHNKFVVVDEETVETGSYNYTHAAAASNAENVVVLWHRPDVASAYVRRFQDLWNESHPVGG